MTAVNLSPLDKDCMHTLEKRGELILDETGKYFVNGSGYGSLDRKRVERLAERGLCRIDTVGTSTFAVFVKNVS